MGATAELNMPTLGPFGSNVRVEMWPNRPQTPFDEVKYYVNPPQPPVHPLGLIEELDYTNNVQTRTLYDAGDTHNPEIMHFKLKDAGFSGISAEVWGRYVRHVFSTPNINYELKVRDQDNAHLVGDETDLYQTFVESWRPTLSLGAKEVNTNYFNPAGMLPTSGENPNQLTAYVRDRWGLESERVVRTIQVVEFPDWLDKDNTTALWSSTRNPSYQLRFRNDLIDFNERLTTSFWETIPKDEVPLIGDTQNRFFAGIGATRRSRPTQRPPS